MAGIYNISAGIPFAPALAKGLIKLAEHDSFKLANMTVFLPTNRAIRALQDALIEQSPHHMSFMPKIQTIGSSITNDLDLEAKLDNIQPAIDTYKRQALLTQLIQAMPGRTDTASQAFSLAGALAHLMDQIHTEGLQLSDLDKIIPEDLANHWQITLDFMKILSEHWPKILEENGELDPALRRDLVIKTITDHLKNNPPNSPIIAAGSTGSIPATAEFLETIAKLPHGYLILPGLDTGISPDDWDNLAAHHPQYGLKKLLKRCEIKPSDIKNWDIDRQSNTNQNAKISLSRAIMQSDTQQDALNKEDVLNSISTVKIVDADHEYEEALVIATALRRVLENPDKTAMLISPDRNIARRVIAIMERWDVTLDDSSGIPLSKTPEGLFVLEVLQAWAEKWPPVRLLSILKNSFSFKQYDKKIKESAIHELEILMLRGQEPALYNQLFHGKIKDNVALEEVYPNITKLLKYIEPFLNISNKINNNKPNNLNELLENYMTLLCSLIGLEDQEKNIEIESNSTMRQTLDTLKHITKLCVSIKSLTKNDLYEIIFIILNGEPVRLSYGTHPRLQILGQIEARTICADFIIMAGLNEESWPSHKIIDPWMSHAMRSSFGLPTHDQNLNLSAHDFVQAFCQSNVLMTRSIKKQGTPTIPSRWLTKLKTIIRKTAPDHMGALQDRELLKLTRELHKTTEQKGIKRPMPAPSAEVRPDNLSITQIETWLKDPYQIYAYKILGLKPLPQIYDNTMHSIKGEAVHAALDQFMRVNPTNIPRNAVDELIKMTHKYIQKRIIDMSFWSYWEPSLYKAYDATLRIEKDWRKPNIKITTEQKGSIIFKTASQNFTLHGRADRIDINKHKDAYSLSIIDYKTGGSFSAKKIESGEHPQLPLIGLMVKKGGFADIPENHLDYMGYWYVTSSDKISQTVAISDDKVQEVIDETEKGLHQLIEIFSSSETPYICQPNDYNRPDFNDYEHLARIKEWSATASEANSE